MVLLYLFSGYFTSLFFSGFPVFFIFIPLNFIPMIQQVKNQTKIFACSLIQITDMNILDLLRQHPRLKIQHVSGYFTDPAESGPKADASIYDVPEKFRINDSGIIAPLDEEAAKDAEVIKGPNIKPFPETEPLADEIDARVVLKTGDNITTDHIMPAGSKILPYRSNIPYLSQFCFEVVDPEFPERAKASAPGIIVGGENYGQGSSREHAALVPLALGIKAVIAKSFARIHAANLVNAGILPLIFENEADYDLVQQGDALVLEDIHKGLKENRLTAKIMRRTEYGLADGSAALTEVAEIPLTMQLADRQKAMLLAGGLLKYTAGQ